MDEEFDIDEIQEKIESLYRKGAELADEHQPPTNLDTPPEMRARLWEYVLRDGELRDLVQYARNYMLAVNKLGYPFAELNNPQAQLNNVKEHGFQCAKQYLADGPPADMKKIQLSILPVAFQIEIAMLCPVG